MMRHHFLPDAVAVIGTMDLVFGSVAFPFHSYETTTNNEISERWIDDNKNYNGILYPRMFLRYMSMHQSVREMFGGIL